MGVAEDRLDQIFNALKKDKDSSISTFRASDIRLASHVPYGVLSGIPQLDLALGTPGYPIGRVIELYGLPVSGKTTAALMALAQVQKMGGSGLFVDTEFAFDSDRAEELGVDTNNVRISEAETIEEVFQIINSVLDALVDYNNPFVIIVDSITAVPTKWERESNPNFERERPGKEAQAIKKGMRVITSKVAKKKVLLVMINHAIETMAAFGRRTKSGGGHSIKFHSSARVNFTHTKELKEKDIRLGQQIKMNIEKVKGAQLKLPEAYIELLNEGGFNTELSLLDALVSIGVIKHSKGSKVYTWGEFGFGRAEWNKVVDQNGGLDKMYKHFIKEACDRKFMKPWSVKAKEE